MGMDDGGSSLLEGTSKRVFERFSLPQNYEYKNTVCGSK